jgi:type IV pilus assembly protein PilB
MRLSTLNRRLGDILLNVGLITNEQLAQALYIQKQSGGKLGTILSRMGAVNEEVMLSFLGKQCGISYVSLREYGDITEEVLHCLPEDLARTRNLIPIAKNGNKITVAMSDPFDILAIDDIKLMTGLDVQVVIASDKEIENTIDTYYRRLTTLSMPGTLLHEATMSVASLSDAELMRAVINHALKAEATDIYLEPQGSFVRVRYRINNMLREQYRLPRGSTALFVRKRKTVSCGPPQEKNLKVTIDGHDVDVRCASTPTVKGERIVLQFVRSHAPFFDISRLGFSQEMLTLYKREIETRRGIIIISGSRKSGRTTTLYATLNALNMPERDIVAIDRKAVIPINGVNQVRPESEIDAHELIGAYIAQTPDVLACGDLTDRETASLLFNAAFSGQSVFTSMAATSALDALQRVRNFGVDPSLIASTLLLILNQQLMRTICPECKISYDVPTTLLVSMGIATPSESERYTLWRGEGCARCNGSGYAGLTGIFEMLRFNEKLKGIILRDAPMTSFSDAAKGFPSLTDEMWKKVSAGITTAEEYLRLARGQELEKISIVS